MRVHPLGAVTFAVSLAATAASAQSLDWVTQAGGTSIDTSHDVAADDAGNTYIIGTFNVQAVFGATEPNQTTLTSVCCIPSQDIFVAKYDPDGALLWARRIGGTDPSSGGDSGEDRGWGIAVDTGGNSYVAGFLFRNTTFVDFGNGVTLTGTGGGAFAAKYDTNGNAVWATHLGNGEAFAIDVDEIGNSYVTGHAPTELVGAFPTTWKLGANGVVTWKRQSTGGSGRGLGVAVDSGGNVRAAGRFEGATTFGSGGVNATLLTAGNPTGEGFVAVYDPNGALMWATQSNSNTGSWSEAIDTDAAWNSYVTGPINGTTIFGTSPGSVTLVAQQVGDMFVAKYGAGGDLIWAKQVTGGNNEVPFGIVVDQDGSSYVTGTYGVTIVFAPGEPNQTALSGGHVFLAKYNTDGGLLWARVDGDESGNGIDLDGADGIHVAGGFQGAPTFGAGEPNETTLGSAGSSDAFVARYVDPTRAPATLDLDIARFQTTKRASVSRGQAIDIKLVVDNASALTGAANATVIGMQNGVQVYSETLAVSDGPGNGRTTFDFPAYLPTTTGDIAWTATIDDPDPDDDEATATTNAAP